MVFFSFSRLQNYEREKTKVALNFCDHKKRKMIFEILKTNINISKKIVHYIEKEKKSKIFKKVFLHLKAKRHKKNLLLSKITPKFLYFYSLISKTNCNYNENMINAISIDHFTQMFSPRNPNSNPFLKTGLAILSPIPDVIY